MKTFLQDFLVILKRALSKKCFPVTEFWISSYHGSFATYCSLLSSCIFNNLCSPNLYWRCTVAFHVRTSYSTFTVAEFLTMNKTHGLASFEKFDTAWHYGVDLNLLYISLCMWYRRNISLRISRNSEATTSELIFFSILNTAINCNNDLKYVFNITLKFESFRFRYSKEMFCGYYMHSDTYTSVKYVSIVHFRRKKLNPLETGSTL